jgi:single-strand DNA-binding protein
MELTGRLTADAKINKLSDERQVANFTLVMNDHFKNKAGEKKDIATFIRCSYWVSPKLAEHLKKGNIISVYGRIGLDVYKNHEGEPQGNLTFHVNNIKFVSSTAKAKTQEANATQTTEVAEDLPF